MVHIYFDCDKIRKENFYKFFFNNMKPTATIPSEIRGKEIELTRVSCVRAVHG